MKLLKSFGIIILLFFNSGTTFGLDIYDEVANAIRSGDSRQLAAFFGNSIDLSIGQQEDVYSKAQAELILRDFFLKNPPKSFQLVHKGASQEGMVYAIGNLQTNGNKNFRVSFYLKNSGGKHILQELRIETE